MISFKLAGDAIKRLQRAGQIAKKAIMRATRKAASRVQRQAKVNVRQVLNTTGQSTGTLSRSITTADVPGELAMAVGSGVIYARIHEFGGVIKPVHAERLAWRTPDGAWRTAMTVTIPKRPYLAPAMDAVRSDIEGDFAAVAAYIVDADAGGGAP
jgi:HK97 gp10 family phage protein